MGALDSLNFINTLTLSTTSQPFRPKVHNASVLCSTQVFHRLPNWRAGIWALVFLFSKLGVVPRKEPLPVPITEFIAA